jgi:hypothetical protein
MYGLKQAGISANRLLQKSFKPFGYHPARHTPGLWLHTTKPTTFSLVVDEFAVKYVTYADANHLRNTNLRNYEITTDWGGIFYSGITLKWDYGKLTCNISMPGYVNSVLNKFQHNHPKTPQHTPSNYVTPVYGAKMQYATQDEIPLLSAKHCTTIQKIAGAILYYSRAVDPTVLMPINDIATEQTTATEKNKHQQVSFWTIWRSIVRHWTRTITAMPHGKKSRRTCRCGNSQQTFGQLLKRDSIT